MDHDPAVVRTIALFKALAHPVRLGIVLRLGRGDAAVHELVDALDVSQPLVSQHLAVLRDAHLVRADREGREQRYALVDDHVAHIVHDAVQHAAEGAERTEQDNA